MIRIIVILISVTILSSCGTSQNTQKTYCKSEAFESAVLRWGGHNMRTNYISGWQIDSDANLYSILRTENDKDILINKIGTVDSERFCRMLILAQKYFFEIQALNAPGDSSHFIQYINPKISTNLRAVWNVRFKTYGSREFRALYDSLNVLLSGFEKK